MMWSWSCYNRIPGTVFRQQVSFVKGFLRFDNACPFNADFGLRYYINTAQIIEESRPEGFRNKAHSIWRNSFAAINQHGPRYLDLRRVADDIAFYNFFPRPARHGDSLAVETLDIEIANAVFQHNCRTLKPTAVVFLSSLARRNCKEPAAVGVPIASCPHPGCVWWNRPSKKYGNLSGKQVLEKFVDELHWPRAKEG